MTDSERGDPSSGSWWAHRPEDRSDGIGRPPWARSTPRISDEPYPLRMFAEGSCEFALWGAVDEPPPGIGEDDEYQLLEDVLPISADLRERLVEWARQNALSRSDCSASELDWMGFHLSRELAATLGETFSVAYTPIYAGAHRAVLRRRARAEPVPGWRLVR
jgi:hypothetical protein